VQHSKIRSRLKAQLTRFTCELTADLSKPLRNFVGEMLFGIQASQGVKLSNIARSLQEEKRFLCSRPKTVSRAIYKPKNWKRISGKDCCA